MDEQYVRESTLTKIIFWALAGVVALIPILFIPSMSVPFGYTKTLLFLVGIFVVAILFISDKLRSGKMYIPSFRVLGVIWLVPLAYLIAALSSSDFNTSLLGHFFEVDTIGFIAAGALLATLTPLVLRSHSQIFWAFALLLFSSGIIALFQILRLFFGADFLPMHIFTDTTANLIGKWNDLAIFFGLIALTALVTLQEFSLEKKMKIFLAVALLVSLFLLAVINFSPVWITIGVVALVLFIHGVWKQLFLHTSSERRITQMPVLSLIVVAVALVFVFGGQNFTNYLGSSFGIAQIEARPSWQSTLEIAKGVYKDNPLGSGPNTFAEVWSQLKPQGVNQTIFWNSDFSSGIGFIPTSFVTTGAIGVIAWLLFLGWLLWSGFRNIVIAPSPDKFSYFFVAASFVGAVYLWVMAFVYTPGIVPLILAFFFTGLFAASVREARLVPDREVIFAANPKLGFASVFALTILLILSVVAIYAVGQRYAGAYFFQKSLVEANVNGNLDAANANLTKALSFGSHDSYYRLATDLELAKLNEIANATAGSVDERRAQFQNELANAVNVARTARDTNPGNYQNWVALGRVYQNVVPLQIEGAYEQAKEAYTKALELAPQNPAIYLLMAELEAVKGNEASARDFIAQSLSHKQDYAPAFYLLAQLELNKQNLQGSIAALLQAASVDNQNPVTFYQLGVLLLNSEDTANATAAFGRAVELNPDYSNALYFLGILNARGGKVPEATAQFEKIASLNPDNQEIKVILENVKAGRDPLAAPGTTQAAQR